MGLKKFSDYTKDKKVKTPESEPTPFNSNPKEEKIPNLKVMQSSAGASGVNPPGFKEEKTNEALIFNGKIVMMNEINSAKDGYLFLEEKKISKDKLWYFMFEKTDEIIIAKYNNKAGFKLKDFAVETLKYLSKQDEKLSEKLEYTRIEGKDEYVRIVGIPEDFKPYFKKDMMNLLGK